MRVKAFPSAPSRRISILFVTDLHGSEYTFRKLLKALEVWSPDVYIGGGDVAGKALLPLVAEDDFFRVRWMGKEQRVSAAELEGFKLKVSQLGFYPYPIERGKLRRLAEDSARLEETFDRAIEERWADWLRRLETHCARLRLPGYVMAGNDDPLCVNDVNGSEREWVKWADGRVLHVKEDWWLISCGLANETPWKCPRDVSEPELERKLRELASEVPDFSNVVANVHAPPHGSSLDVAPALDTSVSPPRAIIGETASVGSRAVLQFLQDYQPLLSLHGHIHESPGSVKIGRTRAINPGSEYAEGILRAALITLEPGRVVDYQLLSA